jgi:hypothetical protein
MANARDTQTEVDEQARDWAAPLFARGRVESVVRLPGGNVNDTFLVRCSPGADPDQLVLQRLNGYVFRDPAAVMANLRAIGAHMQRELDREPGGADTWYVPSLIPALDGREFVLAANGDCWRAVTLVPEADALDRVRDWDHAYHVGVALGRYQQLLSGLPVSALADTLEGFHVTPRYLAQLDAALATSEGKARALSSETGRDLLAHVARRRGRAGVLESAAAAGRLVRRPIHGDPKVANVMIDRASGRAVAMIDLDTSKPGLVQYDFGDCVRSTCNPAGEDPDDPSAAALDTELLEAVAWGYFRYARAFLTDADYACLYDSIWLLAFELSVRFFCDYAAGNRYFKVRHATHNLHRAAVQCRLCESIERQEAEVRDVLDRCRERCASLVAPDRALAGAQ